MKIAILGAGALGCLCYSKLAMSNHSPLFIPDLRQDLDRSTKPTQVQFEEHLTQHNINLNFATSAAELARYEFILVTLKAFQIPSAIKKLKPWLTKHHIICLMHNGMGVAEKVAVLLPNNPILMACTTQAALKLGNYKVRHTGIGDTYIGPYRVLTEDENNAVITACKQLHNALGNVYIDSNITNRLYQKLSINCIINPLTAINQCTNGALKSDNFAQDISSLCDEIAHVFTAINLNTSSLKLKNQVMDVIQATASNHSSMNQDVFLKRQSEIEQITGHLMHLAEQHGIAIPKNKFLYQQIKQIENYY